MLGEFFLHAHARPRPSGGKGLTERKVDPKEAFVMTKFSKSLGREIRHAKLEGRQVLLDGVPFKASPRG